MPENSLTAEYAADLRKTVEQFAGENMITPVIGDYYERGEFPYPIVEQMGQMGLFGLPFPEEYGGIGGDYFALCIAIEELARVDSSVAITLEAGVSLGAMPIYRFGTHQQRRRYLPMLTSGKHLAAFGLTESTSGSDAGRIGTTARLEGDEWIINGSKVFITNSGTDITAFVTVTARTPRMGGSTRSSCRTGRQVSPSRRSTPRWGGTPRTPMSCSSTTCGSRPRTWSASPAAATRSSCESWTRAASPSPRWPPV